MKKRKKKYVGLQKRKAYAGYLFIAPFILGFLMFMVKPMFESLYMSFCDVVLSPGSVEKNWTGLDNLYHAFRVDVEYYQFLIDEFSRLVLYSIGIIVFSFFFDSQYSLYAFAVEISFSIFSFS